MQANELKKYVEADGIDVDMIDVEQLLFHLNDLREKIGQVQEIEMLQEYEPVFSLLQSRDVP